jgi:hypothetical protein
MVSSYGFLPWFPSMVSSHGFLLWFPPMVFTYNKEHALFYFF